MASSYLLRPATRQDASAIRSLVRRTKINPWDLDWRRFLIAVDEAGVLVGCGQLKPHGAGIVELASIAVERGHRRRGVARAIIERLLENAPRPVYLTARSSLGTMYTKWGFRELSLEEMPAYFRRLARGVNTFTRIFGLKDRMMVMVLQ